MNFFLQNDLFTEWFFFQNAFFFKEDRNICFSNKLFYLKKKVIFFLRINDVFMKNTYFRKNIIIFWIVYLHLGSFKKYVCSKLPIFDPLRPCLSLLILHVPLAHCIFTLVSYPLPTLTKKCHDAYEFSNEKWKNYFFVNSASKTNVFLDSYIYYDNKNIYMFIKKVK